MAEGMDVFVVEDDGSIREIELFALKNSGYNASGFEEAKPFFEKLRSQKPDLILLDIMLPDMDGLDIVKRLKSDSMTAKIPIIMVTAKTTEIDKVKGLDIGADDYITKPFGVMELISRVKALLRRSAPLKEKSIIQFGLISMNYDSRTVYSDGVECCLTYKEFELLSLLLENHGNVLTRVKILESVWGTDYEGESRTLDMHIKTLRQKLGDEGKRIITVRNVGYKIE